jgi:serine/threonine-protein kinase
MVIKPTRYNNLLAEDAAVINELFTFLNIVVAERLQNANERKFYIETKQGIKRLLRITPVSDYKWVKDSDHSYAHMESIGIIVPRQLHQGFCMDGALAYQLWTWLDGEELSGVLQRMNQSEQFTIGQKCGVIARKLHSLPPLYKYEPWDVYFKQKVQNEIQSYNDSLNKCQDVDILIRYLKNNIEILENRPTTFVKGDWNAGNLIFMSNGKIGVIDVGEHSGDPWREFWEVPNDANSLSHFFTGQIKGYFNGEPPTEYFRLLSYYIAFGYLEWYPENTKCVLNWFNHMQNPVPAWYLSEIE